MTDLKLLPWEVLRAGSLRRAMTGAEIEQAAAAGISTLGMTCVLFRGAIEGAPVELKVVIDAPGVAATDAIEMARNKVIAQRINID